MTTRHQHDIAWLCQTNDTEALLGNRKISKVGDIFVGGSFADVCSVKTKDGPILKLNVYPKSSKILLIHFNRKFLKSSSFISFHSPPPKKKSPHPNVVPRRYLSHLSDVAIGQRPGHCESVVPGVQTSAAPREAQASLLPRNTLTKQGSFNEKKSLRIILLNS